MKYIKDPTERSTAITDILLALIAFGGIWKNCILIVGPYSNIYILMLHSKELIHRDY